MKEKVVFRNTWAKANANREDFFPKHIECLESAYLNPAKKKERRLKTAFHFDDDGQISRMCKQFLRQLVPSKAGPLEQ
jgi:hypothetical protein